MADENVLAQCSDLMHDEALPNARPKARSYHRSLDEIQTRPQYALPFNGKWHRVRQMALLLNSAMKVGLSKDEAVQKCFFESAVDQVMILAGIATDHPNFGIVREITVDKILAGGLFDAWKRNVPRSRWSGYKAIERTVNCTEKCTRNDQTRFFHGSAEILIMAIVGMEMLKWDSCKKETKVHQLIRAQYKFLTTAIMNFDRNRPFVYACDKTCTPSSVVRPRDIAHVTAMTLAVESSKAFEAIPSPTQKQESLKEES